MTSILLEGFESIELRAEDPEEKLIISGLSWENYEKLLTHLGDSLRYRLTYLDGTLEIMSPSRRHEVYKKNIARLLEAYLDEAEIDYWGLGSTTFRREKQESGKEPDECYCIGTEKEIPDLAIEVVVTSSGINVLEVYKRLEVKEVWFWENDRLSIYQLTARGEYQQTENSALLPNLNIAILTKYVTFTNPRLAVREFRKQICQVSK